MKNRDERGLGVLKQNEETVAQNGNGLLSKTTIGRSKVVQGVSSEENAQPETIQQTKFE